MPAERIDKYRNETADSRQAVDFEICPIPPEQRHAAKHANNKKTKQKAAMEIGPKDHHQRQHNPSRSFQTFCVKNDAKQHCGSVWRNREINIRWRCKRWVKRRCG